MTDAFGLPAGALSSSSFRTLESDDIRDESDLLELIGYLEGEREVAAYLYCEDAQSLPLPLQGAIARGEVQIMEVRADYYRHPLAKSHDYVRIEKGKDYAALIAQADAQHKEAMREIAEWEQRVSAGTQFVRYSLGTTKKVS